MQGTLMLLRFVIKSRVLLTGKLNEIHITDTDFDGDHWASLIIDNLQLLGTNKEGQTH